MKRLLISTACCNLYLRNDLRSRSNTEPDAHPSWFNHLCHTSPRAIDQHRRRTGELCTTEYISTPDDRAAVFRVKRLEGATACDP